MTTHEVEQQLQAVYPNLLKFDGYHHDHNLTLQEFINAFFYINKKHNTITNNPVVNNMVCYMGCKRTIGDIYLITKYYYPDVTIKEVKEALNKMSNGFRMYCCTINCIVYSVTDLHRTFATSLVWKQERKHDKDEFGWNRDGSNMK